VGSAILARLGRRPSNLAVMTSASIASHRGDPFPWLTSYLSPSLKAPEGRARYNLDAALLYPGCGVAGGQR
jgi:hypothetical protein